MKKLTALLICIAMLLSISLTLVSCGGGDEGGDNTGDLGGNGSEGGGTEGDGGNTDGENGGGNTGDEDGEGDEPDDVPPKGQGMDSSSSAGGAGKYDAYNQVIDGNTDYRVLIEIYKEDILDYLDKYGSEMTPEEREIIESYIGVV